MKVLASTYAICLMNLPHPGSPCTRATDIAAGTWLAVEQGSVWGARGSRRRPTYLQLLLLRFRGFSSVQNLSNDPR
jgi:hypothetical protein